MSTTDEPPIREAARFFGRFLRNPAQIGSVLPSSSRLARALTGRLTLAPGELIVEYGPGTGAITRRIAEVLPPGARYLGVELDRSFVVGLRRKFPDLDFHEGSVEHIEKILDDLGAGRPREIVSGLPFASLPQAVRERVIDGTARVLDGGGEFRTFQYAHAYPMASARDFRRAMRARFERFRRIGPVMRNVPPAYVLVFGKDATDAST